MFGRCDLRRAECAYNAIFDQMDQHEINTGPRVYLRRWLYMFSALIDDAEKALTEE